MMSKNNTNVRNQFAMLTIDDLVPQDQMLDFSTVTRDGYRE